MEDINTPIGELYTKVTSKTRAPKKEIKFVPEAHTTFRVVITGESHFLKFKTFYEFFKTSCDQIITSLNVNDLEVEIISGNLNEIDSMVKLYAKSRNFKVTSFELASTTWSWKIMSTSMVKYSDFSIIFWDNKPNYTGMFLKVSKTLRAPSKVLYFEYNNHGQFSTRKRDERPNMFIESFIENLEQEYPRYGKYVIRKVYLLLVKHLGKKIEHSTTIREIVEIANAGEERILDIAKRIVEEKQIELKNKQNKTETLCD